MKITLVHADDWMAVYDAAGDCLYQDHSIEPERLLELARVEVVSIWAQGHADEFRGFPGQLADLRRDPEESE